MLRWGGSWLSRMGLVEFLLPLTTLCFRVEEIGKEFTSRLKFQSSCTVHTFLLAVQITVDARMAEQVSAEQLLPALDPSESRDA